MKSRTDTIAVSIVAGAVAGALLGLIFVPERFIRKRNRMLTRGRLYADEMEDKFEDFLEAVTDTYECVRKEAGKVVEIVKLPR